MGLVTGAAKLPFKAALGAGKIGFAAAKLPFQTLGAVQGALAASKYNRERQAREGGIGSILRAVRQVKAYRASRSAGGKGSGTGTSGGRA